MTEEIIGKLITISKTTYENIIKNNTIPKDILDYAVVKEFENESLLIEENRLKGYRLFD